LPEIIPAVSSSAERLTTLVGGWKLFVEHPIFGAGLGAFRNEHILAASGIPLVIHSTALWLLAELGLVGFLIFAAPAVYICFTEWRRAARDQTSALIILCFVGFSIMSGPADMVYQRTYWLMLGAALAVVAEGRTAVVPRPAGRCDE
jgi:O-antigen ligase